ncbi:DUF262 domain-containing HNH endonuclease family protein [Sphingomonas yunnanensis]|uniref:DUF262 domain-containing protein n=1 Tax=Sphingomonas yunnanensis TaxID=310400 RepID=UPI001CA6E274|nr:DUF262 domain-containing protein [Sphingomonas yunnanensis]MBY9064974.1 DUF262 domain-containing HNH endonuclease family protein [Sphingomonas yunnanensis]
MSKTIDSEDLSLAKVFQSFYRVPDYQREYVWGEKGPNGEGGEQVDQFLQDIYSEFEAATSEHAEEYFIGTIVVWEPKDGYFDLIDGQQRTTTSFLTLCALRDAFVTAGAAVPPTLKDQISSSSMDWRGEIKHMMRLDLQYEDACDALSDYGEARQPSSMIATRSTRNLANAYDTIRDFLRNRFGSDVALLQRFYGYFATKVKLIRIQTPSVSRALKIFETINDRGSGLDGMDLLKNLLFMKAQPGDFAKLKTDWKDLTQELFDASEKPLRFLRYFILANYEVKDAKLREEDIYDWLTKSAAQTNHSADPLGFVATLKAGAQAYARFSKGESPRGTNEHGLLNTRALGGSAIKQHYVLLLAGRHLSAPLFTRLCDGIEQVMCVWLFAGVPAKDYERSVTAAARVLRSVRTEADFSAFEQAFVVAEKRAHGDDFVEALQELTTSDVRQFRMKYLLAKIVQYVDIQAYGRAAHEALSTYLLSSNEVEHILAQGSTPAAAAEFGKNARDQNYIQCLGNLMLLEKSVNVVASNAPYSQKCGVYPSSKFLLSRCQATRLKVGANDRITRAMKRLDPAPVWNSEAIDRRQLWFADIALDVWDVRSSLAASQPDDKSISP